MFLASLAVITRDVELRGERPRLGPHTGRPLENGEHVTAIAAGSVRFAGAVPQFTVRDVVRTAEYYRDVLGFRIVGYWRTPPTFAIVQRDQVELFFNRADQSDVRTGRAAGAYDAFLHVTGVDALAEELKARGARVFEGPVSRVYGQRELVVRDLNGLILCFGEDESPSIALDP
jgi:catechol 2,3-dioxygenase-like lactoylglutathione lyase family enzyme